MSLGAPMATPLYGGTGTTTDVPGAWPVGLNGRPYALDTKHPDWSRRSVPLLRQQADTSAVPAESSLSPEDLWRRAVESWHHGAGQSRLDRPDSDPFRFHSSKGIDCWTRWGLSLLPDAVSVRATVATNLHLAVAGGYLYLSDGSTIVATQDVTVASPTWATVTYGGGVLKSLTSDGYYLYATDGADIYRWARGAATTGAAWNPTNVDLLAYVKGKGRLMAGLNSGGTRSAFNITGAGAPVDLAPNVISPDFTWTDFAEGPSAVYGAGFQGDKSLVFRWRILADGTGLDVAVPALPDGLPDGEIVRSLNSYLGYVLVGTDAGVRFCDTDSAGNLLVGPLIATDGPVRCFEGQDRFVWFGMENYDGISTGLGRLDLTQFTEALTPAWASDLMATAQGAVTSVVTFNGRRVFAVSGVGVFVEQTDLVDSGSLRSGTWTFGLPDTKVALYLDLRHDALVGTVTGELAADGGAFSVLGSNDVSGTTSVVLPTQQRGEGFEAQVTLARDPGATTTGPSLSRFTLEANPAPGRGEDYYVPLLLHESVEVNGVEHTVDPLLEYQILTDLEASGLPFIYQDGTTSESVFLDDHTFAIYNATSDGRFWNGTFVAKLRRPRRRVS